MFLQPPLTITIAAAFLKEPVGLDRRRVRPRHLSRSCDHSGTTMAQHPIDEIGPRNTEWLCIPYQLM